MKTLDEPNHKYKQLLSFYSNKSVITQFGFNPLSVIKPTKKDKLKWTSIAYLDDDEIDERKGYGIRDENGISKMSEFHAGVAENIIKYWSLEGGKIIDPFAGRVTRGVVATSLNRDYYGYEISPNTYDRSIKHYNSLVNFKKLKKSPTLYLGDGTKLENTKNNFGDLVFTCPPYFDIEKYESVDGQLSDASDYKEFMAFIDTTAKNCFRVLKDGGFCVWVVADFRKNCELIPFHSDTMNSFIKAGFLNHDLVVMENISPFASMQLEKVASKRYTSKIHEFILVFRKPGDYMEPDYCKKKLTKERKEKSEFF
jgi:DNA modification methylase